LNLSASDPSSWGRLTEEYFRRKPHEQKRLRQQDIPHPVRRDANSPFLLLPLPKGPAGGPKL
jgi:hypothetical protein